MGWHDTADITNITKYIANSSVDWTSYFHSKIKMNMKAWEYKLFYKFDVKESILQ